MTCTVIEEVSGLERVAYPDNFVRHPNIRHTEVAWDLMPNIKSDVFRFEDLIHIYQTTYIKIAQSFDKYEEWLMEEHFKQVFKYSKRDNKNLINVKIATYY